MKLELENNPAIFALLNNPDTVRAEACRRDFFTFVQEFWSVIVKEDPVYNWHIPFLCKELQKVFTNVANRRTKEYDLIINIPPGTTKSTIVTVMFPTWCWIARNPERFHKTDSDNKITEDTGKDLRFITGSYSATVSLEHSEYARDIIRSDKFLRYFPEVNMRHDKDSKSNFKNTEGGQRYTTSVGATVTGIHAHIIIVDDPLNPKQAASDKERESANVWMGGTLSNRKVNKAMTPTILVMQRLHKDDPTGRLLSKDKKVKLIKLPGDCKEYDVFPKELEDHYIDGLLDPIRLDRDVMDEMKVDMGSYGYAGQIGQDPRPREGAMFQEEWFEVVEAAPAGGTEWVRGWDLAATTEQEAKNSAPAFTAGVRMKIVDGITYIDDSKRFRASAAQVRTRMKNIASLDGRETIIDFPQDPGQAGKGQARDIVSFLAGYNVRYSTESGDKVLRAEPFSAQCEAGNVKLVRGEWIREWLEEVTFFPNGFKDQVDASCRAFSRCVRLKDEGGMVGGPGGVKQSGSDV